MRHIMQGFTMHMDGLDFGIDTEEVTLPLPTPTTQNYRGGGMDLEVAQPMMAIEALEVTVKMAGLHPEIMKRMALGPNQKTRVSFRASVLTEIYGTYQPHVCIVEGAINGGSRDAMQRGEKVGVEFIMNGIIYMRYDVGDQAVHELQAWPSKRIINGVDQLALVNQNLGY